MATADTKVARSSIELKEDARQLIATVQTLPGVQAQPQYDIDLLPLIPAGQELELRFDGINGWVPGRFRPPTIWEKLLASVKRLKGDAEAHATGPRKQILYNVTGQILPGEVLALMGPSGSGKTSLLTALAGRKPKLMTIGGTMLFNSEPLTKSTRRRIGFVLQDDLLYDSLTVHETLKFAALLRLPLEMTRAEKVERVDTVIAALGLQKCRDTIIGGPARRGVSGGERKRVSVGHELLINPSMIMLDEPTSGLDSTTALHLITLLRALASGNRAVLTTIHQPSSRLYQQLDKLMLLSQGHVMYYGAASEVATWFSTLGFVVPFGVNIADFILDLAMGEAVSKDGEVTGVQAIRSMYRTYENYSFKKQGSGYQKSASLEDVRLEVVEHNEEDHSYTSGNSLGHIPLVKIQSNKDKSAHAMVAVKEEGAPAAVHARHGSGTVAASSARVERRGASYAEQVRVLLIRCNKVRRFESYSTETIVQTLLVSFLCGLFWFQRGTKGTVLGAFDVAGLLFFSLLFPAMRGTMAALFTFPTHFRILVKERSSGMYRLSAFYLARMASDIPMDLVLPAMFFTIAYWMGGLRADGGVFMSSLCGVLLLVLVAQSMGMLVGAAVMNPKTGQTIVTILIMSLMLLAGFYVHHIPVWIAWLKYLSFIYWSYNLLIKIQYAGVTLKDCSVSPCVEVTDLQSALGLAVDPNSSVWLEVVVQAIMLVVLRVAIYWTLRIKTQHN